MPGEGTGQAVVSGPGNRERHVSGVKNEGSLLSQQLTQQNHSSRNGNNQSLLSQLEAKMEAKMDAMAASLAALAAKHKATTRQTDKFIPTLARELESQEKWTTIRLQSLECTLDNSNVNKVLRERLDDHDDTIKDLEERLDSNDLTNKIVEKKLYTNHSAIKNLDEYLEVRLSQLQKRLKEPIEILEWQHDTLRARVDDLQDRVDDVKGELRAQRNPGAVIHIRMSEPLCL